MRRCTTASSAGIRERSSWNVRRKVILLRREDDTAGKSLETSRNDYLAGNSSRALRAASISARFLVQPIPCASSFPLRQTAAFDTFLWSGPSEKGWYFNLSTGCRTIYLKSAFIVAFRIEGLEFFDKYAMDNLTRISVLFSTIIRLQ